MKYLQDYKELHSIDGVFSGNSTPPFKERVYDLVKLTGSETLLDYGSGKGRQYSRERLDLYWGVEVDMYEPAIEELSRLPDKKYDGVICISVMEHIPDEEIDEALQNIFSRAEKFVLLGIDNYPSRNKKLKSGEGVHVSLHDEDWWRSRVKPFEREGLLLDLVVMSYREQAINSLSQGLRSR